MTKLCAAIFVNDLAQAKRDIALAAEAGADMVELRMDRSNDRNDAIQLLRGAPVPCIVTYRAVWEGGFCELDEPTRAVLLAEAADEGAAYVDVELKALQQAPDAFKHFIREKPRDQRSGLIVSSHHFSGRPEKLYGILSELNDAPGDINKLAWTARSIRDNLEAFEVLKSRHKPTIALCMGESGLISRILAKKFSAFLTFASLPGDAGTAPGQISVTDMKRLYRWDSINPSTRVYGVVGSPVAHSMSPAIHNAAFDQIGHDGVYLPLLVQPGYESFKAFMETFLHFEGIHLSGLSITIPHKENALRYLQEKNAQIDPLAQSIGALNTIVIKSDGSTPTLTGFSTDYPAILDSITSALNISREQLADYRIAVLGAGGTGRTAVAALAHYGATVVVYNRTRDRADALASDFNGKTGRVVAAPIEKLCDSCCHIFINTTSVGMHPNVDQSPLGDRPPAFTDQTLVFDTIYNPIKTKLLRQAEQAGAKTISGIDMFLRQAAGQFQAWTGQSASLPAMRRILESRLNP